MSSRIPEIKQIQALMDRVDTHRHQPQPASFLTPEQLANQTLDIYRAQGVDVDAKLVHRLAQPAGLEPLPHKLPQVPLLPSEKLADRLFVVLLSLGVASFLATFVFTVWGAINWALAGMIVNFVVLALAFPCLSMKNSWKKDLVRRLELLLPVLQNASQQQLVDVLEHPDIDPEVSRQVRLEMVRRRRLGVMVEPAAPASRLLRG